MSRSLRKRKGIEPVEITNTAATTGDHVNHPPHYNRGRFEVIDVVEQFVRDYPGHMASNLGEVLKYIARAPYKGNTLEDLQKARWYMNRAVGNAEEMSEG